MLVVLFAVVAVVFVWFAERVDPRLVEVPRCVACGVAVESEVYVLCDEGTWEEVQECEACSGLYGW